MKVIELFFLASNISFHLSLPSVKGSTGTEPSKGRRDSRKRRADHPIHSFHLPGVWKWRTPSENSECGKDVILKGNEIFKIKATVEPPGAISSAELLRPGNRKTQAELLGGWRGITDVFPLFPPLRTLA
ncbi:hypothetical protein NPIL_145471 [Nephila pilipes]|uniref:Uncharacterized protein n=1 Tax=Nephila pilipes TaxID=299642 RepID=A0A8X6NZV5_NEPPI|nr:hypothetical protein NPIL_145471 [Nephila pilipes]